ncbi:MAG: hypothetical protein Q9159_001047 [Coniocarpon cinnabarinum]
MNRGMMNNVPDYTRMFVPDVGEEVQDAAEGSALNLLHSAKRADATLRCTEVFDITCNAKSNHGLGMIDSKAQSIEVTVAGHDYTLQQSLGILQSNRSGGTTGGAIWQASVHVADWLASSRNPLASPQFAQHIAGSSAIELGCGICPLLALAMRGQVARYIATDQEYILPHFQQNLTNNTTDANPMRKHATASKKLSHDATTIETLALDWEIHDVARQLRQHLNASTAPVKISLILACDCVFNEYLVQPFVQTCLTICDLQRQAQSDLETAARCTQRGKLLDA